MVIPIDTYKDIRAADRGLYRLRGQFDVFAAQLQIVKTPTGTPINITANAADVYPRTWYFDRTLEAAPNPDVWTETESRIEKKIGTETPLNSVPAGSEKSSLQVFTDGVAKTISDATSGTVDFVKYVVIAAIVILVLILMIKNK